MTDEFRPVKTVELTAMFDLRARAFEQGTASDWAAFVDRDPWRDASADLVAVSDERVVATLSVLARRIAGVEAELRLAGIGAVASDPDVRRQGFVRRLLALAHATNRAAGYDLAMLFTRSHWVYSGSAAFVALPSRYLDIDAGRLPAAAEVWTIEPGDPPRHLAGMQQVYELYGRRRPAYPLRGHAYWAHPERQTDTSWTRVALDRDGQIAAYMRVRLRSDGRAIVLECPYLSADAVYALAHELLRDPVLGQYATIGGRFPRDHALVAAGEWQAHDGTMACAYTQAGSQVLEALLDPADQRSVYWYGDGF